MVDYYSADKECPVPAPFGANVRYLIAIGALFFLSFLGRFIFAPLMPTIERDLGISHTQAGSLFLMISIGLCIAQLISGFLTSRINHKGTLFVSTLVLGFPLLVLSFVSNFAVLKIALFVIGMAAGLHVPSAVATITAIVERKDWGKALSLHGSAPPLALTVGPFLIVLLLNYLAWQSIIAIIGLIAILVSFVFLRFFPCGQFPGEPPRLNVVKTVFGHRSVWILIAIFSVSMVASVGIYTMLTLYLTTEIGFSIDLANTLLGLSAVSGLFSTFLSGILLDRIGEKKQIAGVMLLAGVITILLGFSSGWLTIVVIFIQPAILSCFPAAGMSAVARSVHPNLRSITTSLVAPIAFLAGGGFGPVLIGYMGETFSFRIGIVIIGCLLLITPVSLTFLKLSDVVEQGC